MQLKVLFIGVVLNKSLDSHIVLSFDPVKTFIDEILQQSLAFLWSLQELSLSLKVLDSLQVKSSKLTDDGMADSILVSLLE